MDKKTVLQGISFGHRIAEEETSKLSSYFVETDQWRRIYSGEVDVIYGAKGSGKSAIYALLMERQSELFDAGIVVVGAENPRGTPAFKELLSDPPTSEVEFVNLWKLYTLSLVGDCLKSYDVKGPESKRVVAELELAGLLKRDASLGSRVRSVMNYVRSLLHAESIEGGLKLDPHTGMPNGVTGKVTFKEPSADLNQTLVSTDALLKLAETALRSAGLKAWILFDRLDVAFAENQELEQNALRALFKVYLDLASIEWISLKIFLRNDIWQRITQRGFREASHITKHATIAWDRASLLNLIVRRLLRNEGLRESYSCEESEVLADLDGQVALFYRVFPKQVDPGAKQRETLDWMLSRTSDALSVDVPAPRELIHLLTEAKNEQLQKMETGENQPVGENLIGAAALKDALPQVSKVRLEQTLLAEYPEFSKPLRALDGERTQQTSASLAKLWGIDRSDALKLADALAEVGFFSKEGSKDDPQFWVPFLYRSALNLVQGTAD